MQRMVDQVTAILAWPGVVGCLAGASALWAVSNTFLTRFGLVAIDPPPFVGMQTIATMLAVMIAALILTTQRREDQLADHRAQLILELSISNDQKISKVIGLLEEGRRDNPAIEDRIDAEATAMSTPSDTRAVLDAIKETTEGAV